MAKVRNREKKPKVSGTSQMIQRCEVPDYSVFFNFQYITSDVSYNLDYIKNAGGNGKSIYHDLLSFLQRVSQSSWEELRTKGKKNGGFETLEYSMFKKSIAKNIKHKVITDDTKLYVFRFGGNKYRLIGYKSNSCKAALHILGFDFDYSLYNHGN